MSGYKKERTENIYILFPMIITITFPSKFMNFRSSFNTLWCQVIKKEGTENIYILFPHTITITYPSKCVNFRSSCNILWCQVIKKKVTENIYILLTMTMTILNVWILDLHAIQSDVRLLKRKGQGIFIFYFKWQ